MKASSLKVERKTVRCTADEARNLFAAIPAKAQRSLPGHAIATIIDALSTDGTADLAATLALLFPSEPLDKARRRLTTEIANRVYVDDNGNAPLKIVQTRKGEDPALIWLERTDLADTRGLTEAGDRYAPDQFVPAEATRQTSAEIVSDIAAEKIAVSELAVDSANETAIDNDKTLLSKNVARDSASPAFTNVRNQVIANSIKPNNAANDSLRGSNLSADQFTATDATRVQGFSGFTESAVAEPDAKKTVNALDAMLAWAADKQSTAPKLLALLGDYGTGKTSYALQFSRVLNGDVAHPKRPDATLSALHIDLAYLRGVPGLAHLNVTQIVAIVIEVRGLSSVLSAETVVREVREGRRILVYDGLDELMQSDHAQLHSVFRQLLQALEPDPVTRAPSNARLMVSCRTHYFRDLTEQHEFFNTQMRRGVTRKDYLCLYLLPWKPATVRDYLNRRLSPDEASALSDTIAKTYNLEELASCPVLLAMMCEQVGEVLRMRDAGGGAVTASTLYAQTVAMWVRRDDEKHVLQATHKPVLMGALACAMWNDGKEFWEADRLDRWLRRTVDALFPGHYSPERTQAIQDDLRTATFIVRPGQDGFTFAHRSFMEFFLARHVWAIVEREEMTNDQRRDLMPIRLVGLQVAKFFRELWLTKSDQIVAAERFWRLLCVESKLDLHDTRETVIALAPQCNFALFGVALEANLPWPIPSVAVNLRGLTIDALRWERRKFPSLDFTGAKFSDVFIKECVFECLECRDVTFVRTSFVDCDFTHGERLRAQTNGLFVRHRAGSTDARPARLRGKWSVPGAYVQHLIDRQEKALVTSATTGSFVVVETPPYCRVGAMSNSREYAVTVDVHGNVACWHIALGRLMWSNRMAKRLGIPAIATFSTEDKLVAISGADQTWIVLHAATGFVVAHSAGSIDAPWAHPELIGMDDDFNLQEFQQQEADYFLRSRVAADARKRPTRDAMTGELRSPPIRVNYRDSVPLALVCKANAAHVSFMRDGEKMHRVFVHSRLQGQSTACFDEYENLVDYDEEAADTWLRYLGNGYPQPVEAAWLEIDEFGRALGPKKTGN